MIVPKEPAEVDLTTDADLLAQFTCHRDEQAFSKLLHRHGPMVLGVCVQILRRHHDAQDAFQATFLVLALRARSIKQDSSLASWLYKVAYRTAMRAAKQRQKNHTEAVTDDVCITDDPLESIYECSLQVALHEELTKLPAAYRAPLVLCYLQGKSRRQAADELECTASSIKARLARAKQMLRSQLSRRGVALSVALLSAAKGIAVASDTLSQTLVATTVSDCSIAVTAGLPAYPSPEISNLAIKGNAYMSIPVTTKSLAGVMAIGFAIVGLTLWASDAGEQNNERRAKVRQIHEDAPAELAPRERPIPVQLVADDTTTDDQLDGIAFLDIGSVDSERAVFLDADGRFQYHDQNVAETQSLTNEKNYLDKKAKAYFMLRDAQLERARVASDLASRLEAKATAQLHEAEAEKLQRQAEILQQQLAGVQHSAAQLFSEIEPAPCCRDNNLAYGRTVTASSQEEFINNFAQLAVDGDLSTRWCSDDYREGEWIQVDLGSVKQISAIRLHWEMMNVAYSYTIETSKNGKDWTKIVDTSDDPQSNHMPEHQVDSSETRFLRITFLDSDNGSWASIREIEVSEGDLSPAPLEQWEKVKPDADGQTDAFLFFLGMER